MTAYDWIAIAAYVILLLALSWRAALRTRETADDYFLAAGISAG